MHSRNTDFRDGQHIVTKRSISDIPLVRDVYRCRRAGHTTWVPLIAELLFVGLIVWFITTTIPVLTDPKHANSRTRPSDLDQALLKIAVTSSGQQLWVQRGPSEIVSLDLSTHETTTVYKRFRQRIGNWCVSQSGTTFLLSLDDCEVQIVRDRDVVVSDRLVAPSNLLTSLSSNGSIAARVAGGRSVHCWDLSNADIVEWDFVLPEPAERIALNPSGDKLVVSTSRGEMSVYDVKTGSRIRSISTDELLPRQPVFSEDGRWLAVLLGDGMVLYDFVSGEVVWKVVIPSSYPIISLAISTDGNWVATTSLGTEVCILDRSTGEVTDRFSTETAWQRIAFSPSNDSLYATCTDAKIRIWSLSDRRETQQLDLSLEPSHSSNDLDSK